MIIALGFAARVGKDTAADYLVKHQGFIKLAFANPLKEAVRLTHGYSDEQLYGNLKEVIDPFWGETPRQTLQRFGTDALRTYYRSDLWVMATKRKLVDMAGQNVVISDCRFPNEAEMIKGLGGFVVRINATFDGKQSIQTGQHSSELAMESYNDWDWAIKNDSTIESYYAKVQDMFEFFNKDYKELSSGNRS
jgi:hypothetical protein